MKRIRLQSQCGTGGPCMKADGGVAMLTSQFVGAGGTTIKAPVRFIPISPQTSGTKHITASQNRWGNRKTLFAAKRKLPENCAER